MPSPHRDRRATGPPAPYHPSVPHASAAGAAVGAGEGIALPGASGVAGGPAGGGGGGDCAAAWARPVAWGPFRGEARGAASTEQAHHTPVFSLGGAAFSRATRFDVDADADEAGDAAADAFTPRAAGAKGAGAARGGAPTGDGWPALPTLRDKSDDIDRVRYVRGRGGDGGCDANGVEVRRSDAR